ncbi:MAG: hypothetical protein R3F50_01995 [Gammaproteobacteria bacterium]
MVLDRYQCHNILIRVVMVVSLLLALLSISACGNSSEAKDLLQKTLKPFLTEMTSNNVRILTYCPDNLCLAFEVPTSLDTNILYKFALAYFYFKADFPEFREYDVRLPNGANPREAFEGLALKIIQDSSFTSCDSKSEAGKHLCALRILQEKHGIEVFFTRTDEGHFIKEKLE